ncbi:MAG TPA: hypothetical protein VKI18_07830 [Albitalea sp.]|nr:hypothetical protein [Albitalea sp.]
MQKSTSPAFEERVRAFHGVLRSLGQDATDFEITEDQSSDLASFFGWGGGILTVRRRSTGEAHSYATGVGSAWFGALLMDMARGRFAPRGRLPAHA